MKTIQMSSLKILGQSILLTFFFAVVSCEHLSALANSVEADSSILTRWIANLWLEIVVLLNNHICTLDYSSIVGLQLQLYHGSSFRNDILWESKLG